MSNAAIFSHGVLLKRETTPGSGVFNTIAELVDVQPPELSRNEFETTSHNDPQDSWILGLLRKGELPIKINWVPTDPTHDDSTGLLASFLNASLETYQIIWTGVGSGFWECPCYVKKFKPTVPEEGVLGADVVLRPSGSMTFN